MRRLNLFLLVPVAILLAGCTSPSGAPSSSPTGAPVPVTMNETEAGERYLEIVCPANDAMDSFNAVFTNAESTIEDIKSVAAPLSDSSRIAAEQFDDSSVIWPESVAEDIEVIRDSYLSDLSTLDAIQSAESAEQAFQITFDDSQAIGESSQRIRLRLDLPSDTIASCDAVQ